MSYVFNLNSKKENHISFLPFFYSLLPQLHDTTPNKNKNPTQPPWMKKKFIPKISHLSLFYQQLYFCSEFVNTQKTKMRWERVHLQPPHQAQHHPQGVSLQNGIYGPGKRWGHTCNAIKEGRLLYVFGGYGRDNCQTNQVHVFDTGGSSPDAQFCS